MDKFDELKKQLDVLELEERLEMVQLAAVAAEDDGSNGCCCGSDGSCDSDKEPEVEG